MSFNKYVVAIGVALSFLMASLNAAECPADTPKYINKVDAECRKLWEDYNAMSAEEKADESENSKNVKIRTAFDEKCDQSRNVEGPFPKCSKLTPAQCVNEPSKCKLVGEKCQYRPSAEQANNQTPCAASIGAQGTYCSKVSSSASNQCLCGKTRCIFDCSKMTNEAACATEPTACSWNGSECTRAS